MMDLWWMVAGPVLAAAVAWLLPGAAPRKAMLALAAAANLAGAAALWLVPGLARGSELLRADAIGVLFLLVTGALFLVCSLYTVGYLRPGAPSGDPATRRSRARADRWFAPGLLLALASMNLVLLSRHFGVLWVGVEATTLATAPLIHHARTARSLEATWRYLLLCSVGIALALLGTFSLGLASGAADSSFRALQVEHLVARAATLDAHWLRVAFVLLLVGYGTKMGLAPFHTWLPDAHGEAPAPVSALLSGALLNCAFVAVLRGFQVCAGAGLERFASGLLLGLGLLSLAVGAVFVIGQRDYKRMLAFSSVEHMGVLATGIGMGGVGVYGALYHAVNHSIAKALMFLVAGNLLTLYGSRRAEDVRGVLWSRPLEGVLLVCGYFAVSGVPPFGTFFSEFMILQAGLAPGHMAAGITYLALLAIVAVGMAAVILPMVHGRPRGATLPQLSAWRRVTPAILALAAVTLGLWMPPELNRLLSEAARSLAP
jgi:hydrogenase-4 component F